MLQHNNYKMHNLRTRMEALEERINYTFKDPDLLKSALTFSANTDFSNERMEFLGDRVLGLVVSDFLYNNFIEEEGCLAKISFKLLGLACKLCRSRQKNSAWSSVHLLKKKMVVVPKKQSWEMPVKLLLQQSI